MKTFILTSIVFLLFSPVFYAQEKEDDSDFKNYSSSVFNSKQVAFSLVSSMDKKAQNDLNQKIQSGINIQQIGDLNTVTAFLKSKKPKLPSIKLEIAMSCF